MIELTSEAGHLVTTRRYDETTLTLVSTITEPKPGYQLGGHRTDCRCPTCRPDCHLACADTAECARNHHLNMTMVVQSTTVPPASWSWPS